VFDLPCLYLSSMVSEYLFFLPCFLFFYITNLYLFGIIKPLIKPWGAQITTTLSNLLSVSWFSIRLPITLQFSTVISHPDKDFLLFNLKTRQKDEKDLPPRSLLLSFVIFLFFFFLPPVLHYLSTILRLICCNICFYSPDFLQYPIGLSTSCT